nr:hypothetical protein 1634Bnrm1_p135 [Cryptomonas sp.]
MYIIIYNKYCTLLYIINICTIVKKNTLVYISTIKSNMEKNFNIFFTEKSILNVSVKNKIDNFYYTTIFIVSKYFRIYTGLKKLPQT